MAASDRVKRLVVPPRPETAAERLRVAFDLLEDALELQRARLRREHPEASHDVIERWVDEWLRQRPGAEHGDAPGRPIAWPRRP